MRRSVAPWMLRAQRSARRRKPFAPTRRASAWRRSKGAFISRTLDPSTAENTALGTLITPFTIEAAREHSREKGLLDGRELARVFAWMRPNDLIWNYWVSNYLLGNTPPAF